MRSSDFVTNSYGESWDSFCEKSRVPVKKHESVIENAILKLKYSPSIGEFFVYVFCLINICSSLSNEANKIKPLNIEKA